MHVVIAGGGTAGHVEPALATADALRRREPAVAVTLLGTARGLESRLVPDRGYPLALIPAVPMPRQVSFALAAVPARLLRAVHAAGVELDRTGADVVVGFGGYVALPAYLAARRRRLPIVVHEANARPGLANQVGARLTRFVATAAGDVRLPHAKPVGVPLRRAIASLDRPATRAKARAELGLDPTTPTLLVFGGSQGARRLNVAAVQAAPALRDRGVQVLHLAGAANAGTVAAAVAGVASHLVLPYLDRMELAYAAADLALCRAGAMTCAELAAVGLPAGYVPLPIGNGEQRRNAAALVAAGGGLLVDDATLDADWVIAVLAPLLLDSSRLSAMSVAAARFGIRDADDQLAAMVVAAARAGRP